MRGPQQKTKHKKLKQKLSNEYIHKIKKVLLTNNSYNIMAMKGTF